MKKELKKAIEDKYLSLDNLKKLYPIYFVTSNYLFIGKITSVFDENNVIVIDLFNKKRIGNRKITKNHIYVNKQKIIIQFR